MGTRDTIEMFLKIVIFLPFIIFLIYLFFKYGGDKLQKIQNGRYMKIMDRMPLNKENSLLIVKLGNKAYVMSSTQGRVEILMEIAEDELKEIEKLKVSDIKKYGSIKEMITKQNLKKEDRE